MIRLSWSGYGRHVTLTLTWSWAWGACCCAGCVIADLGPLAVVAQTRRVRWDDSRP
jgi:hypothetical protein